MNKPFVALLCALTVMATVNMAIATGPMIQKVFVTNWPTQTNATVTNSNLNVTVTNPPAPPTVNLNITTTKPALDVTFVKGQAVPSCSLPTNFQYSPSLNTQCPVSLPGDGGFRNDLQHLPQERTGSGLLRRVELGNNGVGFYPSLLR